MSAFGGKADIRCDDRITFEVDVAVTTTEELGKLRGVNYAGLLRWFQRASITSEPW
jgi:hypothetical protein